MSKNILNICLSLMIFLLVGCVGSPVHTSSMSSVELRNVDNYTLCKAYTPRELYSPSATVIYEVQRRGLNCGSIYTYDGAGDLIRAAQVLQGVQNAQNQQRTNNSNRASAFYTSHFISGFNKICIYNRLGSDEAYTFKATDICPLSMP